MNGSVRYATAVMIAVGLGTPVAAQGPPGTEIYLARLQGAGASLTLGTPVNVTTRPGYDNQPFFAPDGTAFYYTSYRGGQADVYRYDLASRSVRQITSTPESEFSPTVMPSGNRLSVVRVEADSTQRLWSFALDGSDPRLLIPSVAPVGYHAWLSGEVVALFVLGSPNSLEVFHALAGRPMTLARNIGRTLARVPGTTHLSYVQQSDDGSRWIAVQDSVAEGRRLIDLPASEFFAWLPDASALVTADGTALYWFRPGTDSGWRELADVSAHGTSGITRLAVSPDGRWIAFVATESEE